MFGMFQERFPDFTEERFPQLLEVIHRFSSAYIKFYEISHLMSHGETASANMILHRFLATLTEYLNGDNSKLDRLKEYADAAWGILLGFNRRQAAKPEYSNDPTI